MRSAQKLGVRRFQKFYEGFGTDCLERKSTGKSTHLSSGIPLYPILSLVDRRGVACPCWAKHDIQYRMRGQHEREVIVASCSKLTYVVLRSNVFLFESHCNVSQNFKDNPQLGTWVSSSGKSSPKTIPEAHRCPWKIGFKWILKPGKKRKNWIWVYDEIKSFSVPKAHLSSRNPTSLCCSCKC